MATLVRLTLSDRLKCQGTQAVYGVLYADDLSAASDIQAIDDQESLTFRYTRVDGNEEERAITAEMRAGRVITVVWDDGSFEEWRVGTVQRGRGEGGLITVSCVSLWLDLVERSDATSGKGWVSDLVAGVRNFEYELTARTPTGIWTDYVIPACPSWVTAGTIEPTYEIPTLTVSRLTPGALALAVRDTLRNVDVACEVRLRRNGTTDYKLDLVTQVGASAVTPVFHPANALTSLTEKSDPTLQATRVLVKGGTAPDGESGQWGIARWVGGAPSGLVIALTDPNGGSSPIAFDDQFVGQYLLRVKTGGTFLITASDATLGTVTLSSVSTIAAGEFFEFRLTEPGTNTRTTTTRYAISAVPDGTHITCGVSVPITADHQYVDWYAKVWSLAVAGTVIATTKITDTVAATDVLTVASSAGVNNTHYVEFVQLDGAGEVPCFVDHPTESAADPDGYGIKCAELSKPMLGVTQLCENSWMRTWTNSGNPPDGWSLSATSATSQNTNAAFTRYGDHSWKFTHVLNVLDDAVFTTPPCYPNWTDGLTRLSCRAWLYLTSYLSTSAAHYSRLNVYARTATGGLGASLGECRIQAQAATGVTAPSTIVATDTWVELRVEGITLGPTTAPYGVVGVFTLRDATAGVLANNTAFSGYLDVIEFYPFLTCPSEDLEFGDATALLQAGNNHLRTVASPPLYYTFTVNDLARAIPDEYSRLALTLGGNVRAADLDYGIDTTVRLLKLERDLLDRARTKLTLANKPTLLTTVQSTTTAKQRKVVSALNAGTTSVAPAAFVAPTTATTLTVGAEVQTPSASAPVITLPVGTDTTGAAVTYVPADPTTTPQTVVTVGRPPSRTKPMLTDY